MPQKFKTNTLILGNQVTTTTGSNIYIDDIFVGGSGSISAWTPLSWNVTTIWPVQTNMIEERKILVNTGTTSIKVTGLYNGWCGVLKTIQSGNSSSGYALSLSGYNNTVSIPVKVIGSGGSVPLGITRTSGAIDVFGFEFDGSHLLINVGSNFA